MLGSVVLVCGLGSGNAGRGAECHPEPAPGVLDLLAAVYGEASVTLSLLLGRWNFGQLSAIQRVRIFRIRRPRPAGCGTAAKQWINS